MSKNHIFKINFTICRVYLYISSSCGVPQRIEKKWDWLTFMSTKLDRHKYLHVPEKIMNYFVPFFANGIYYHGTSALVYQN